VSDGPAHDSHPRHRNEPYPGHGPRQQEDRIWRPEGLRTEVRPNGRQGREEAAHPTGQESTTTPNQGDKGITRRRAPGARRVRMRDNTRGRRRSPTAPRRTRDHRGKAYGCGHWRRSRNAKGHWRRSGNAPPKDALGASTRRGKRPRTQGSSRYGMEDQSTPLRPSPRSR
jgi:hypothetical protein